METEQWYYVKKKIQLPVGAHIYTLYMGHRVHICEWSATQKKLSA